MQVKPRAANFENPLKSTHAFREMVRPAAPTYRVGVFGSLKERNVLPSVAESGAPDAGSVP
jgi:hypothetical protein